VKAIFESNFTLVTVVPPSVEEAPAPEAAPVIEEGAVAPAPAEEQKEEKEES
jgi:hypothetical protein